MDKDGYIRVSIEWPRVHFSDARKIRKAIEEMTPIGMGFTIEVEEPYAPYSKLPSTDVKEVDSGNRDRQSDESC